MLQKLLVQNFALIDHLELHFPKGFIGITGETGSGKSILLNALGLLIGDRADYNVIGDLKDKSIVEGEFNISTPQLIALLQKFDIDESFPLIIRREISKSGKARIFINDTPVALNVLREFGTQLVYIHSQYNTLELKSKSFQLQILDDLANINPLLEVYQSSFKQYQNLLKRKSELIDLIQSSQKKVDYNTFILNEINTLDLERNNFSKLEQEWKEIDNASDLLSVFSQIYAFIEDEEGARNIITKLKGLLDKNIHLHPSFNSLLERIQSINVELKEIASEAIDLKDNIDLAPEKKQSLEEKLDNYQKVLFKHQIKTQDELVALKNEIESELNESNNFENELNQIEQKLNQLTKELFQQAESMHQVRVEKGHLIAKQIKETLNDLKLPDTELIFDLKKEEKLHLHGVSSLSILFSANKGIPAIEIEKAASGGELSRVMLALQYLTSKQKQLPTLFFDEIDTGVSGEVALKIGLLLKKMGENAQVIAISHLPQVVAKSNAHFKVFKAEKNGRVNSSVLPLTEEEKTQEIARLLSGSEISAEAVSNAKILINH